jgi:hopanoid C-3 methylase
MKVLLIQPRETGRLGFRGLSVIEPLALEIIAACLPPEHDVKIVDFAPNNNIEADLSGFRPDVVGVSCCFTMDVYRALDLCRQAKTHECKPFVMVGGHHPTLNPQDFNTPNVDVIVMGEGEITARELMKTYAAGGDLHQVAGLTINEDGEQVETATREQMKSIDSSPLPRRDLVKQWADNYYMFMEKPLTLVETSRGCPFKCNFCSVWRFYRGKCRVKSAEIVLQDLQNLNADTILFSDDNFLLDINRARSLAALIKSSGLKKRYFVQARSDTIVKYPDVIESWKEIGLGGIFIGMESASEEQLVSINKHNSVENNTKAAQFVQSLGVGVWAAFIVDPKYSRADFQQLRDYIRSIHLQTPSFSVLTPLPGTEMFAEVKDKLQTYNYELYDLLHAVIPTKLGLDEFYQEFASLYSGAYDKATIIRQGIMPFIADLVRRKKTIKHIRWIAEASKSMADPGAYLRGYDKTPDPSAAGPL